jgi:hypothetical protein
MKRMATALTTIFLGCTLGAGCTSDGSGDGDETGETGDTGDEPLDPDTAPRAEIDRFSEDAGMLMVRDDANGLPGPNEAVDFDVAPFITTGLGPDGSSVQYYNFDVQPTTPAPIYVLFREGEDAPVDGQLNIIDVIPGDAGYNDFWAPMKVTVPTDYVANTITSVDDVLGGDYSMEPIDAIVNCPVVPEGSTATQRHGGGATGLVQGWYDDQVVFYFEFGEAMLSGSSVPLSPIYVSFNVNPDEEGGGPGSGFMTEADTEQTHNVVATVPGDDGYSPLWLVNVYDNAEFDAVSDLASAESATLLGEGVANVNCPVVSVGG